MNRLARETSPYLLQHKDNPVDWYAWGEEALARARALDRPILLSIGYSACHWCHVMEHESFENPAIARQMNELFVCIKVDREERPDLDHIYQGVAQALTRSGGWPLTVFLTPELKPYFGGTYFPPEDRYGRPGFPRVLDAIARAYREDPQSVAENAEKLTAFIRGMDQLPELAAGTPLPRAELLGLAHQVAARVDPQFGGLLGAPKFPNPMIFSFLARMAWLEPGDRGLSEALHVTLERMAAGGIFDQLGGGFHRYSVDATWSVPHFEKMLYDNGLLLRVYSEALCLGGPALTAERRELYLRAISMTVDYLLRELRSPEGAFYSTQDADSEGEEGRFFVWRPSDLEALVRAGKLSAAQSQALARRFGITDEGNFEHGATVLSLAQPVEDAETERLVAEGARILLEERARRVAPATDRKILAGWNGLAISGLAWASQALGLHGRGDGAGRALEAAAEQALSAAEAAFDCIVTRMRQDTGAWMLCATLQEGVPKHEAYLDDYAFLAAAALDLSRFGAGDGARYLGQAREWCNAILVHFEAEDGLGFYFTSENHEALIHRPKTVFDQAIPSGTAVALGAMAALGDLLEGGGERYAAEAASQLGRLGQLAARAPLGMGELLCATALQLLGPVTVQGERARELCRHPHVFRKPGAAPRGTLVCHRGTCLPPEETLEGAWRAVEAELRA